MMNASKLPRRDLALLHIALLSGLLACVAHFQDLRNDAPRQGWWKERGPVVPHDTFPADCSLCHAGDDWQTIRDDFEFDHERETGVPLNGAHAVAECLRCHNDRGPVEIFAQRGCGGCHEDVHRGQLGEDCSLCHDEMDWTPSETISMHARTRLPLVGAHAAVACWVCHPGANVGSFRNVDPECVSCHLDEYQATSSPDHEASSFPTTCEDCHGSVAWESAQFSHVGITDGCIDCHLGDFQGTTDPDHEAEGFATTCEDCHGTSTWQTAGFSHAGITDGCAECHLDDYLGTSDPAHQAAGFPQTCELCHGVNLWPDAHFDHGGVAGGCAQCHLPEYRGTTDPDHEALIFPTSCENCHGTTSWLGAAFDHTGITSGCVRCHLGDYQGTLDPRHQAAGIPTTCEDCHDPGNWHTAQFPNHDFPIYSGPHANFACSECHVVDTDYHMFSCTHCHAHQQSSMDSRHDNVSGYVWQSSACYECHPDGRG